MIHILLPAYNEAETIGALLTEIDTAASDFGERCRIVLVDDGSTDGTADRVRTHSGPTPITLLQHEGNRGFAAALSTGIKEILHSGETGDLAVTMDADLTHSPRLITDLKSAMSADVDVVVASRYAKGGQEIGVSAFRKLLSHGAALVYRLALGNVGIHDFSCGYRMIRWELLQRTWQTWGDRLLESEGFSCTGELFIKLLGHTKPERLTEVPFVLHYELKRGESKMPVWRTIKGTLRLLLSARRFLRASGMIEKR
ncbi:MAG: glycosyltransferase family 2 protein [bacterium]